MSSGAARHSKVVAVAVAKVAALSIEGRLLHAGEAIASAHHLPTGDRQRSMLVRVAPYHRRVTNPKEQRLGSPALSLPTLNTKH
jgi:hypothetical protein